MASVEVHLKKFHADLILRRKADTAVMGLSLSDQLAVGSGIGYSVLSSHSS